METETAPRQQAHIGHALRSTAAVTGMQCTVARLLAMQSALTTQGQVLQTAPLHARALQPLAASAMQPVLAVIQAHPTPPARQMARTVLSLGSAC